MPELENDQTPEIPDDFAAYEAYRNNGGELPKAEDTEDSDDPEEGEEEAKTASESETDEEAEQDEEEEAEPEQPKRKSGIQNRFDKLTKKIHELESQLAQKPAGSEQKSEVVTPPVAVEAKEKPQPKDFSTWEEYTEALTDWKIDQREKAREEKQRKDAAAEQQKAVASKWSDQVKAGRDEYDDFDEVVVQSKRTVSPVVSAFVLESEVGRHVAYKLGSDPGELDRINKLSPVAATRELLKIEQQFTTKPAQETKPKVTKAPKPVKPVSGVVKTAPRLTDPDIAFGDYEKLRAKQLAQKRR